MKHLFICISLIPYLCIGQEFFSISGYIYDSASIEPLVAAHITTEGKTLQFATSNNNGYYKILIKEYPFTLNYSFVGYSPVTYSIETPGDTIINVYLPPSTLQEVVVSSEQIKQYNTINAVGVPLQKIKSLPSLGGEVDILKALTLMPGISPTIEGSTGLNVRGGSPDQNLILLDEAPVYNVSHLFGFVSVFNPYAIKNMEVLKGGFPARYGGRLSSVINIAMNEGNKKSFESEVTVGLLSSKLNMEIPLQRDKTSLMLSGRSSYLDLITLPQKIGFNNGTKNQLINYSLLDGNIKIHHLMKNNASISLSHYSSRDKYSDLYRPTRETSFLSTVGWDNMTNTLRYNKILNQKVMFEGILYHTRYRYNRQTKSEEETDGSQRSVTYSSGSTIEDVSAKAGIGFDLGSQHRVYAGLQFIHHWYAPLVNSYQLEDIGQANEYKENIIRSTGIETALFIEDDWQIDENWSTNLGIRHSAFLVEGKTFSGFEPRVKLNYKINSNYQMSASHSYMRQYIHLLTNNTTGLPNDIWVPVTGLAPPEKSWISTLGIAGKVNNTYRASGEIFYKQFDDLIDQGEGSNPSMSLDNSWDELIENNGKGQAYGLEFYLEKQKGKLKGWLSYTLSWNHRQFDGINDGVRYPYRYDRRHQISLVCEYPLSDKWTMSGNWVFMTGYAITTPVSQYFINDPFEGFTSVLAYDERNNGRMPDYHRLDLTLNRSVTTKRNRRATLSLGVYNVYARRNPLYVTADYRRGNGPQDNYWRLVVKGKAYFVFIPSISYTLKF